MKITGLWSLRRTVVIAAFAALLPFQAFAQNPPAPQAPDNPPVQAQNAPAGGNPDLVRIAINGGWEGLPAIVAIERGFFDQENVVASALPTGTADGLAQSLVAGSTDFAEIPQRFFIALAASNIPIKAVAVGVSGIQMELVAKPGSGFASLADLKGKTVGMANSTESLGIFMRLLNSAKMAPGDVTVKLFTPAQVETAFDDGQADAIFESRYYTLPLVQAKKADVVMNSGDVVNAIGVIDAVPLITTDKLIQNQPDLVERVVRAWIKALVYIQQDPRDAAALLQIYLHRQGVTVPVETAQVWVALAQYNRYNWSQPLVADAEYNAWGLQQANVLKVNEPPKLAGFVDNTFAEKAMQSLQIK